MATYKVLQDIEAEDKFVGPLTLKQFIFAAIFVVSGYLSFLLISKHVWVLALPFLPVMLTTGFLAFPWGRDQPTEIWLLAKIRFFLKPRLRVWDQTGVQELVTITAPKKIEAPLTNNLSQTEVKSRLRALADTIDSRGWAVKNVNVNLSAQPAYVLNQAGSDRLIDPSALASEVSAIDVQAGDDMLDEQNNRVAQQLDQMINTAAQEHRQEMLDHMQEIREHQASKQTEKPPNDSPQNFWFMNEPPAGSVPAGYATFSTQAIAPGQTPSGSMPAAQPAKLSEEEQKLLERLHKEQREDKSAAYGHMKVIDPTGKAKKHAKPKKSKAQPHPVTQTPDPAILKLAVNNDRNVASLAREANASREKEPPDEVVISLR